MGTSIENGGGGGEEVEEVEIPWSCVDETIRKELIIRLNPENVMSGNNWRGLAGRLDYTTAQIMAIESEKGNNTREFFNSYDLRANSSYNEVLHALEEMERQDCVNILKKYLPRIKRNAQLERDKEAKIMEQSMATPPCPCHYPQNPQHSMGLGGSCTGCACGPLQTHPSMGSHHRSICSMPPPPPHTAHHNGYNSGSGGFPSSPCCHMGAMTHHPLGMPSMGGCMAGAGGATCGNHSPTRTCSHTCARQQSCTPSHLQMDISQTIPKCNGAYYYPSGPPIPSVVNHSNTAFSDQPQGHNNNNNISNTNKNNMTSATSPTSCQYYNVSDPSSYSPQILTETKKPYNFSVSGSCSPGNVQNGFHLASGGSGSTDQRNGGTRKMEQPHYHNNLAVSNIASDPNLLVSNNFSSQVSNENNMSYPSSSSMTYYDSGNGGGEIQQQQPQNYQQHQHHQNGYYQTESNGGGGTGGAAATAKHLGLNSHDYNTNVDSKKSLQKLTEISKMPGKYQPTMEYKTIVAEQDVDNKKQRSRMARSNGNGGLPSSSSGNSMTSSSSSSSQTGGVGATKGQQEELPQMAGLSLGKSPPEINNIKEMRSNVYVTYSKDNEEHKKDVLRLTIFLNANNNSVWADVCSNPATAGQSVEPYQEYYGLADFILICLSPKYLSDIADPSSSSLPATTTTANNGSSTPTSLPIHTYQIYHMMMEEHKRLCALSKSAATAANGTKTNPPYYKRFVSLLFGGMSRDQVPSWLKQYPVYKWPEDYRDIGWLLKKPKEWVCS